MLRLLRKFIQNNRGQSAVEFAVTLPIFLMLVGGSMEGGRILYEQIIVTEAAREGARVAIVGVNNDDVSEDVTTAVKKLGVELDPKITYRNEENEVVMAPVSGGTAEVEVTANVEMITPLMNAFFKNNIINPAQFIVYGKSTMRVE